MTEQEKKDLKEKRNNSGLNPDIKTLRAGTWIKNANCTGNDDPAVGSCWKEYWQIFTQKDFSIKCPLCGEYLAKADVNGCHIMIYHSETKHWTIRKYIVPGHHSCNKSLVNPFPMQIAETVVEAIEK